MRDLSCPAPPESEFRVRIQRGNRSRTLAVRAASEDEARARALEQAGGGDWEIRACDRKRG
jgi:hypothetical protein